MDIINVVLVLGKRLVDNTITAEGRSRVEALIALLAAKDLRQTVVLFCGGVTEGQTVTEAQAMYDYFKRCVAGANLNPPYLLLEDQSTNTIENISNAANKLIESGLCAKGEGINVQLVSNDYHLKRIFEIQALMDEQGLLRVLEKRCAETGLPIKIDRAVGAHYSVPYPHDNEFSRVFLLLDELTTYRVYLQGYVSNVFKRPLADVREQPYQIARNALIELEKCIGDEETLADLDAIKRAVEMTTPQLNREETLQQLKRLDVTLTKLNRQYDPERQIL